MTYCIVIKIIKSYLLNYFQDDLFNNNKRLIFNTPLNVKVVLNYLPFKFSFLTFGKNMCDIERSEMYSYEY